MRRLLSLTAIAAVALTATFFAVSAKSAIITVQYSMNGTIRDDAFSGVLTLNYDTDSTVFTFNSIAVESAGGFDWDQEIALTQTHASYVLYGTKNGPHFSQLKSGTDDFFFFFQPYYLFLSIFPYQTTEIANTTSTQTSDGTYINDVKLERIAVPEVSTWVALLLGFGGLGLKIRREKRTPAHSRAAALTSAFHPLRTLDSKAPSPDAAGRAIGHRSYLRMVSRSGRSGTRWSRSRPL